MLANNPTKAVLHSSVQGPALLSDPNDVTTSFIRSIDPKTGSTSKIEANAAIDEYSFAKNRNAFQRGSGGHNNNAQEAALAPGEAMREIQRNDFGHERRVPPNNGDQTQEGSQFTTEGENNTTNASSLVRKRPHSCLLYTSPSPRDKRQSRMPSSA